jgi:kumamolisin
MDLFISYQRRDSVAVSEIRRILGARGVEAFLDQDCLIAGLPWPEAIESAILSSAAVVVVVGRGPLGEWQKREMYLALDLSTAARGSGRDLPVIPVLLEGAEPATSFLFQHTWVDFGEGINSDGIDRLVLAVRAGGKSSPHKCNVCPYRALEVFREEDHPFYFGRESFVSAILEKVLQRNLVAVVGPSGSGKSSVVQAGLLPLIRRERNPGWEIALFTPGGDPWYRIADALQFLIPGDGTPEAVGNLARKLESHESALGTEVAKALIPMTGSARLLLIVDQFEELFTQCPADKAHAFLTAMIAATNSAPVTSLLTINAEFYNPAIKANRALADMLPAGQINLGPLNVSELREVIVRPAKVAGCVFESDKLVERIVTEVQNEPGRLPLLEYALSELWLKKDGTGLTATGYEETGGVTGAIGKRAERVFCTLVPADQEAVRRLFGRLVYVSADEHGADMRRRCKRGDLAGSGSPDDCWKVARVFAEARNRLLVISTDSATREEVVEVAHEALLRGAWPRLKKWIDLDRDFLNWRQDLELLASIWAKSGTVLPVGKLSEAKGWLKHRPKEINTREREFIERCLRRGRGPRQAIFALVAILILASATAVLFIEPGFKAPELGFKPPRTAPVPFREDGFTVPQVTRHYNFPDLDGRGQTIAFVEISPGGYLDSDLDTYFRGLGLQRPEIAIVPVGGTGNTLDLKSQGDVQVESDIEVAGSVAPRAKIVLYFSSTEKYIEAVDMAIRANSNRIVVVHSAPFSESERNWNQPALQQLNQILQSASTDSRGVTVIASSGNNGVRNGVYHGPADVEFPASSPWVLACGGTKLTASGQFLGPDDATWNDSAQGRGAGGGMSGLFPMPDWQLSAVVTKSKDGTLGRGVPDVAANADPETGYRMYVDGQPAVIGGTQLAASLWAGLIALVNQGVGHGVGYINRELYTRIGPSGALRNVTKGAPEGCAASSGWNACTGLGSPDGEKLLKAFKALSVATNK